MNDTQQKLIEAADRLLHENGLARATTRKIAQQAEVSEGLLYHHFKDKAELINEVVFYRLRNFHEFLENLPFLVGQYTVAENLIQVLEIAYNAHCRITAIICGVISDHRLRSRTQEIIRERQIGPERTMAIFAAYLAAEQKLGRINKEISPFSAAQLLLASSLHGAMLDQFLGNDLDRDQILLNIRETVHTVLTGLNPTTVRNIHQKGHKETE